MILMSALEMGGTQNLTFHLCTINIYYSKILPQDQDPDKRQLKNEELTWICKVYEEAWTRAQIGIEASSFVREQSLTLMDSSLGAWINCLLWWGTNVLEPSLVNNGNIKIFSYLGFWGKIDLEHWSIGKLWVLGILTNQV